MPDILERFPSAITFPRSYSLALQPELRWLLLLSSLIVIVSCVLMLSALVRVARRRPGSVFLPAFVALGLFVVWNCVWYLFDVAVVWRPVGWQATIIPAVTALMWTLTAIMLWRLLPVALPSAGMAPVRENERLLQERIAQHLHEREQLESRVHEATAALALRSEELRKLGHELRSQHETAQTTLHSIADAVITTDQAGRVMYLNPVAEQLTGWSCGEAVGLPVVDVFCITREAAGEPSDNPVHQALETGSVVGAGCHTLLTSRDGQTFWIEDSAAPIRNHTDEVTGVVIVFHDVSASRKLSRQLSYQASHDALTGLINRHEFERRIELAIRNAESQNQTKHYALLYLDLDQFKIVNDSCGHHAGDELLRQIASVLLPQLREGDTLARLGGDEFGVLLENCLPHAAVDVAKKLKQALTNFQFVWREKPFHIGVSIGMVTFCDGSLNMPEMIAAADNACYVAKDRGRDRIHVYHPDDSELVMRHGEMQWVGHIRSAIRENRLRLYCQRIVEIGHDAHECHHHEVLLRMVIDDKLVPPMAFIPAAERYNLMPLIDRWVIHTAFRHQARLMARGRLHDRHTCAINLSGKSLTDDTFLDFVLAEFEAARIPYRIICFEITETAAIANLTKATQFIRELKSRGCRFSLDDFGSGMSSFGYLKNLPVDYLKIDGAFVRDMVHDPIDFAMIEAIHHVAVVMGIKTIAEFVENDDIMQKLQSIGINYAQGNGVSLPTQYFDPGEDLDSVEEVEAV